MIVSGLHFYSVLKLTVASLLLPPSLLSYSPPPLLPSSPPSFFLNPSPPFLPLSSPSSPLSSPPPLPPPPPSHTHFTCNHSGCGYMARPVTLDRYYESPRRLFSIMSRQESNDGKRSRWTGLEIRGPIKNLSPELWSFTHLTSLFLNDNNLQVNIRTTHTRTCTHTHTHTYACTHTRTRTRAHTLTHTYTDTHTHTHTRTHMHALTHTHTYACIHTNIPYFPPFLLLV